MYCDYVWKGLKFPQIFEFNILKVNEEKKNVYPLENSYNVKLNAIRMYSNE